jgi:hypothetical protein
MKLAYGEEPEVDPATEESIPVAIAHAAADKDNSWLMLSDGDEDFIEATAEDDGTFEIEVAVGDYQALSTSTVDNALLQSILVSFLRGDDQWRSLCRWELPVAKPKGAAPGNWYYSSRMIWIPVIGVPLLIALGATGYGAWIVLLFALAFPGLIAFATLKKVGEVKRASTWTKASARIVRSELATTTHHGKEAQLPLVEYEFSVSFHPVRGSRISIGEIMPGTPEAQSALKRYPVGASAPVYYNPANPKESVLERDLPEKFWMVWIFIAVLAVICVGGAVWFVGPAKLFH